MNFLTAWKVFTPSQRKLIVALFCLTIVSAFMEVVGLGLLLPFVQVMTEEGPASEMGGAAGIIQSIVGGETKVELLIRFGAVLIVAFIIKGALLVLVAWMRTWIVQYKLYIPFARKMLSLYLRRPYADFISSNSAHMLRDLTSELRTFFNGYVSSSLSVMAELLVVSGIVIALLVVDPMLTLICGGILVLTGLFILRRMQQVLIRLGRAAKEALGGMFQWVQQALGSAKETKILGTYDYFLGNFDTSSRAYAAVAQRLAVFEQIPRAALETVVALAMVIAVVFTVSVQDEVSGADRLAKLVFLGAATVRMTPSIVRAVNGINKMRTAQRATETVLKAFAIEIESNEDPNVAPLHMRDSIVANDLTFAYAGTTTPVLRNLNLTIPAGSSAAFVGSTGAGKTTIIDIMLGLLEPTGGEILADGVNISSNRYAWRKSVAYVPQNVYLADTSVRDNVLMGQATDGDPDDAVWAALHAAQVGDFVEGLPLKLDTMIGEHGVRFSGGQRQRLVIARALISNPDVIILDEATSALDNETEAKLTAAIDALGGDKTVIVVAHRLSTIRRCDQIFVLSHGEVEASGTYDELLVTSPTFARLASTERSAQDAAADQPDPVDSSAT